MAFRVISAKNNLEEWESEILALPLHLRDLHFSVEYFRVYEETYSHKGYLFIYETSDAKTLYPFLERNIDNLELESEDELSPYRDIESVYGYGGPISYKTNEHLSDDDLTKHCQKAIVAFENFCRENKYVSEFCLLHPFLNKDQADLLKNVQKLECRKEIAWIDLRRDLDVIWSRIDESQRKAIAVARKRGVQVERTALTEENVSKFHDVYIQNMSALRAGRSWFFPDNYYQNCVKYLGAEKTSIFSAKVDGVIVASIFLLHAFDTVYYHFSATLEGYNKFNPIVLLLFDSISWAKAQGYKFFHLGGGRSTSQDDSLLRFKYSLCHSSELIFFYTRIVNFSIYSKLMERKIALERTSGVSAVNTSYFPQYRR